jgi:Glycosyl hydrolases family 16
MNQHRSKSSGRIVRATLAAGALATSLLVTSLPSGATTDAKLNAHATSPATAYPLGVVSAREPSGMAPPSATSLPGYKLTYTQDFSGKTLPTEWGKFNGVPSGDPGSMFVRSHVLTGGGVVRLVTSKDKANGGNWATGGMCLCAKSQVYGAFFVRSRVTGPGPNVSELLWPVAHVWPPEVDFNEMGYPTNSTSWTVHYGVGYTFVQTTRSFNMLRWHTWGVIWTPRRLLFTMDGKSWGALTTVSRIPHQRMTLDIQQQTWCNGGNACPHHPVALQVDWVATYKHK